MERRDPDFVVGHPRSGTQLLAHLLCAADPDVARWESLTLGERKKGITGPFVSFSRTNHPLITAATDYYEGRCSSEHIRELLRRPSSRVETNWKLTWVLPPLLEEFPSAKLMHLVRDPRQNVLACHNLEYYGRGMHLSLPNMPHQYQLFYYSMPYIRRDDWQLLSPFERNCAFWVETHRLILEQASRQSKYLMVRQDDLNDPVWLAKIFAFFEISLPTPAQLHAVLDTPVNKKDEEIEAVHTYVKPLPRYPEWPVPMLESFKRICGDMAARLGYDL